MLGAVRKGISIAPTEFRENRDYRFKYLIFIQIVVQATAVISRYGLFGTLSGDLAIENPTHYSLG